MSETTEVNGEGERFNERAKKISKTLKRLGIKPPSRLGKKHSAEAKIKIGIASMGNKNMLGKKHTDKTKQKIGIGNLGKKRSEATRKKISQAFIGARGNNWRGGVTKENILIRKSLRYRLWREKVFKRDNYTCQICKKKGERLEAHHIKSVWKYPERRFWTSNGMTLCKKHHKQTDSYLKRIKEIECEQTNIFIEERR